ncbi:MAG: Holliday junction branch migration protein RuvA [Cephaloticoccus sp.]|nr:Holliday junction branch migration protein RuvA [Cephaloticoccus sp.]
MITSIEGVLAAATPLRAVVEIGGFGYEVNIPVTTAEKLPATGEKVKLHTLVVYREDAQTLYGFASATERDFFRLMIEQVSGVGPKVALTIMSKLSLPALQGAIGAGDVATLAKCPGIGKKTAERLVVELKGRVASLAPHASSVSTGQASAALETSPHQDAILALTALGYKPADADKAVRAAALALGAEASTEALIKKALG